MLKKTFLKNISILILIFLISCNTKTRENLIVGTWLPIAPAGINAPQMHIKFLANKIAVAERNGQKPSPSDSVIYEIKNEGKTLVTTEKSGRIDEVEIVKLTAKDLILFSKKNQDTIRLIRE